MVTHAGKVLDTASANHHYGVLLHRDAAGSCRGRETWTCTPSADVLCELIAELLAFFVSCFIILLLVFQSHSWALHAQKGIAKLQLFSIPTKHLRLQYVLNNLKISRQYYVSVYYKIILTLFFCCFLHFSTAPEVVIRRTFQQVFHKMKPIGKTLCHNPT